MRTMTDPLVQRDQIERDRGLAHANAVDPVSAVIGSPAYSSNHRFPGLRPALEQAYMSGALAVSRFYFGVTPKVAVDVVPLKKRGTIEVVTKRAYCEREGILYVLLEDIYDGASVATALGQRHAPRAHAAGPVTTATAPSKPAAPAKPARQRRPRTKTTA
jgi:hypothetical protein